MEWLDASVVWWHWVTLGLLLALGEMLLPSFFLLLVGVSAICVGLLLLAVDMSFTTQLLLWGGLSVLDVVAWFVFVMARTPARTRSEVSGSSPGTMSSSIAGSAPCAPRRRVPTSTPGIREPSGETVTRCRVSESAPADSPCCS